ncbi:hypothetical protein ACLOJK_008178 [Asimina triloba]
MSTLSTVGLLFFSSGRPRLFGPAFVASKRAGTCDIGWCARAATEEICLSRRGGRFRDGRSRMRVPEEEHVANYDGGPNSTNGRSTWHMMGGPDLRLGGPCG